MIPRLWYVTDGERGSAGRSLREVCERAAAGGAGGVLVRERELGTARLVELLRSLLPLRARGVALVVSRRLDLARALDLDGAQLSADSVDVATARHWLGTEALVGYSAHSGPEARRAASDGASYVMLSPIYPTESKPGAAARGPAWLQEATRDLPIPALALGGLSAARTSEVLKAGAWGVAAVSAIGAAPDPTAAAERFQRSISEMTR